MTEGNDHVCDTNYYTPRHTPLQEPIEASSTNKVKLVVNKLFVKTMTKPFSSGSKTFKIHPEYPNSIR